MITGDDIRAERERTHLGMNECKLRLQIRELKQQVEALPDHTDAAVDLKQILRTLVDLQYYPRTTGED